MKYWLRWIAVLPGAVLGGLLATVPLRLVLYSTLRNFVEPFPEWPERVLTPFVIAACFVWVGARIAPSHRLKAGIVLFGLWMVLLGVVLGFAFFGTPPEGTRITLPAGGLPAALAFVGGLVGLLIVRRQTARSEVRGGVVEVPAV